MILKIGGEKYDFEIFSKRTGNEFRFFIRATDKIRKRTSCINNLNTILSWLDADIYDSRFLSDLSLLNYLEKRLDEDREWGEWENIAQHQ